MTEPLPPLDALQNQMIAENIHNANWEARKMYNTAPYALDLDDLRGLSQLGLMKAARRWYSYAADKSLDPNATEHFLKFARLFMMGAMRDAMRKDDWAKRGLRNKSRKLRNAGQDQGATVDEMSQRSGLTKREVYETIHKMSNRPVSLEAEEIDVASIETVESSVVVSSLLTVLVDIIKTFDPVTQTILALHYYEDQELQEISKILGITNHLSSELHTASVIRIRDALARATLEANFDPEE